MKRVNIVIKVIMAEHSRFTITKGKQWFESTMQNFGRILRDHTITNDKELKYNRKKYYIEKKSYKINISIRTET